MTGVGRLLRFAQSTFDEVRTAQLPNPQTVDPAELIAFFGPMGRVANLRDEDRRRYSTT